MIGIIVMLAVFAAVYMVAYGSSKGGVADAPVVTAKVCPLHQWVYDPNDKLVCSRCSMRPGQNQTKNGEY